jgi:hypothetical protein
MKFIIFFIALVCSSVTAKESAVVYHNKALHDFYERNINNISSEEIVEIVKDGIRIPFKEHSVFTIKNGEIEQIGQVSKVTTKTYDFKKKKVQTVEYEKLDKMPAKH